MSLSSFCSRHPLATLITLVAFIYCTAAIAGGGIQFQSDSQLQENSSNPHHIPDHMNPKSRNLSNEIKQMKMAIQKDVEEVGESVHSIAFRGRQDKSQAILDYTTGTSN